MFGGGFTGEDKESQGEKSRQTVPSGVFGLSLSSLDFVIKTSGAIK